MRTVTIDCEARSIIDLAIRGLFVYWGDPLTEMVSLQFAVDNKPPKLWVPDKFQRMINPANLRYELAEAAEVNDAIASADKILAFNSLFEYVAWKKKLTDLLGWPMLPMEKIHDVQAQCLYAALPATLEHSIRARGLPIEKDSNGHKIMLKLCKPRTPVKAEKEANPAWRETLYWHEGQADMEAFLNYGGMDVEAERMLHWNLPELPPREREHWLLTEKLNLRGLPLDLDSIRPLVAEIDRREVEQRKRFIDLTDGKVSGPLSHVALRKWVNAAAGLELTSVAADIVDKLLEDTPLPPKVTEVLRIRNELSKSSTAKLKGMLERHSPDGRLRGAWWYHKAFTGRWASTGVQWHNPPKDSFNEAQYEKAVHLVKTGQIDLMKLVYDDPFYVGSRCIRGSVKAPPGKKFLNADFHSVEGMVLAWEAGEQWVIDAYREGKDVYKMTAAMILKKPYEDVTKAERDKPGKIAELSGGYQGGAVAVRRFGGVGTDEELKETIVEPWRAARPMTVRFWAGLERAAKGAVLNPGRMFAYRRIQYIVEGDWLKCYLPSGRAIHYYKPLYISWLMPWGKFKKSVTYLKPVKAGMIRTATHGGKETENAIQGECRDLLAEGLLRLDKRDFMLILHVHDEGMSEEDERSERLQEFIDTLVILPWWAEGMPLTANGWEGKRFRK